MGLFRYFGQVLRKAWPDSWGWSQNLVIAATLGCGAIVDFWPGAWTNALRPYTQGVPLLSDGRPDVSGWQITLTLLALIFALRLIWAAYRIQSETEAKVEGEKLKIRELEMLERHHQDRLESEKRTRNLSRIREARRMGLAAFLPPEDQQ